MGVFRVNGGFGGELQGADKGFFQLRQKMQGAAQKCHTPPDGLAAGKAGDGLIDHGLKNGSGQVGGGRALVDERLNVGFRKHAAAGGDGINFLIMLCLRVQSGGIGLEQGRHLVDEGAGAAGADAVHPFFQPAPEINNLGVLAAQFNGHVGLGRDGLQCGSDGHHLLHEADAHGLAEIDGAGACDLHLQKAGADLFPGFGKEFLKRLLGMGTVAAVLSEQDFPVFVQQNELDGG